MEALKPCPACGSPAPETYWTDRVPCQRCAMELTLEEWQADTAREDALRAELTAVKEVLEQTRVHLALARNFAQTAHQVAELAWGGEIPSPLPGHRHQTEEEYAEERGHLNCPLCSGSGHVGDCNKAIVERIAKLEAVRGAAKLVDEWHHKDVHTGDGVQYVRLIMALSEALQAAREEES